jgi:hypothetical protein
MLVTETGEMFATEFPTEPYYASGNLTFGAPGAVIAVTGSNGEAGAAVPLQCPTGVCGAGPFVFNGGTLDPEATFTLSATESGGTTNTYTFAYSNAYNTPSSLAAITGTWGGNLSIDANGGVKWPITRGGPNVYCTATGQVSLINPIYNAYDMTLNFTNCGGEDGFWTGFSGTTGKGILTIVAGTGGASPGLSGGITINATSNGASLMPMGLSGVVPYAVANGGIWTVNEANVTGGTPYMVLLSETGQFYALESVGFATGNLNITGTGIVGNFYAADFSDTSCSNGYCPVAATSTPLSGTINQEVALTLTGGDVWNGTTWAYSAAYNYSSSLTATAGTWSNGMIISSTGAISGQVSNAYGSCSIDGQVSIINPNYDAYNIGIGYTACTGDSNWTILDGAYGTGVVTTGIASDEYTLIGGITINLGNGGVVITSLNLTQPIP